MRECVRWPRVDRRLEAAGKVERGGLDSVRLSHLSVSALGLLTDRPASFSTKE